MDNAIYASLTRLSGLVNEMQTVANNIANASTTGYRREGIIFSEYIEALGEGEPSLSMAHANVRDTRFQQATLTQTGGTFDFAIEGNGFFMVEGPDGPMLTRAGSFTPNANGDLATPDGFRLLDSGSAPIFVPPDAQSVSVAADGTLSADGQPLAEIGLWAPADPNDLVRTNGVRFAIPAGAIPAEDGSAIVQGFLEGSNVDPIKELTRMIEVQRSYEQGQKFLQAEDERIRSVIQTLGK